MKQHELIEELEKIRVRLFQLANKHKNISSILRSAGTLVMQAEIKESKESENEFNKVLTAFNV